jgi:hypothetical protein
VASKLWNLRLDDETRTRWEGWAERDGYSSLAEFVKAAAEEKGSGRYHTGTTAVPGGGKRTYEPDFKTTEGRKKR